MGKEKENGALARIHGVHREAIEREIFKSGRTMRANGWGFEEDDRKHYKCGRMIDKQQAH